MAQGDSAGSVFGGMLSDFAGSIFGHPASVGFTPGGGISRDAKEALNASAAGFPPDGSQILAPAGGPEAALSRTTSNQSPITAQNRPAGMKVFLMIAGALAVVYLLRKG